MTDPNPDIIEGAPVVWQLDAQVVPLRRLVEFVNDILSLLHEVQEDVVEGGGVQWIVESISKASPLALRVAPRATRAGLSRRDLDRVSRSVSTGLRQIQRVPRRPPHYSDRALVSAQRLVEKTRAQNNSLRIESQTLDAQFLANIEQMLGGIVRAIGTIEGRLEAVNVHGGVRHFYVYDSLTGERVMCDFGHRVASEQVGHALEHRVAVHGEITYRESGSVVRMSAQSLELFPPEEELPSSDDVRGILA